MNRYIIYIVIGLIIISSCVPTNNKNKIATANLNIETNDSIQDKFEAINDYFNTQVKDPSEEIIVMKEKIRVNMTLKLLRINDIWAIDSTGMRRKDETFYKEEEWESLRKQYGNYSLEKIQKALLEKGECCWTSTNFKHKKIIFENLKMGSSDFEKKYLSKPSYDVYWFSEPVYYKNKEYIVFSTYKASLGGYGSTTRLIIMKKIKNKWVQVYEGLPDWYS